jgi:hypothetical protein
VKSFPGLLLDKSSLSFSISISKLGGTPSTTTPTEFPCDSPKVVILSNLPKVFNIFFNLY